VRVAVLADKEREEDIKAAGADLVGNDKIIKEINEGVFNFDKLIATPE
jgi:large subunit ribosomal protein L1